ncbi:cytochrome ubiquinol oxidase subunit I [Herbidospora sp. NEAU-GS84]|uniref:Cytochrome ubiquinol oxidase subunit I n=1 Tax=Herbidospora solisilvae TaxID=2696284 RepID=A0A7C9J6C5_9ACTN|nr:cytochrome ubiquinol oxidase subunit I [Herbidospora solisilvae]NAS20768.1 cytochrome ubiquinol oxidase subunit I [Herbidospora solisilvae]
MDVLDLARLQFAVTGSLHFLFVVLTLGLAPLVAIMHTRYARTGTTLDERMTRFWGQIYVTNYALGIVTGIVMEFQFGLSWSGLTHYAGDVFGAPLAMETLIAFFLESTFLGLWIFGWHRLPKWLHVATIWLVTLTAYASAFWIMVANSFLQHPAGAVRDGDVLRLDDFGALLTNPSLSMALPHVLSAGLTVGGFVVMGASAYHLFRKTPDQELFSRSLRMGIWTSFIGTMMVVGFGFAQFGPVTSVQPGKFADRPLAAFGLGFMIMLGHLLQLVALLLVVVVKWAPRWRFLHPLILLVTPLPFAAAILGWIAREEGRQPWMIWERLKVADALTPGLTEAQITLSFAGFVGVLTLLAVADYLLISRIIRRGPDQIALGEKPAPAPALTF